MKKIELGQSISIIANIGIIAGIVFLAFELNQNNKLLEVSAVTAALENRIERNDIVATNESLAEIMSKNRLGETLTDVEFTRLRGLYVRTVLGYERDFFLWREDVISDQQFGATVNLMAEGFRRNEDRTGYRVEDYWEEAGRRRAAADFRQFVDQCLIEACEQFPLN